MGAQPSLMPMGKGAREEDFLNRQGKTNADEAIVIPGGSQEIGATVHKSKRKCSQSYKSRTPLPDPCGFIFPLYRLKVFKPVGGNWVTEEL